MKNYVLALATSSLSGPSLPPSPWYLLCFIEPTWKTGSVLCDQKADFAQVGVDQRISCLIGLTTCTSAVKLGEKMLGLVCLCPTPYMHNPLMRLMSGGVRPDLAALTRKP